MLESSSEQKKTMPSNQPVIPFPTFLINLTAKGRLLRFEYVILFLHSDKERFCIYMI